MKETVTGKPEVLVAALMRADRDQLFDLSPHKDKRSLSQNNLYWRICGMTAQALHISTARLHNTLLRDVGLVERMGDDLIPVYLPDTDEAENQALEATTYHIRPTSQVKTGKDGKPWRCYVMLRGSHTFNVEEMSRLLDLMIAEAKEQGIDTITPDELAHIREMEKQREQKRTSVDSDRPAAA